MVLKFPERTFLTYFFFLSPRSSSILPQSFMSKCEPECWKNENGKMNHLQSSFRVLQRRILTKNCGLGNRNFLFCFRRVGSYLNIRSLCFLPLFHRLHEPGFYLSPNTAPRYAKKAMRCPDPVLSELRPDTYFGCVSEKLTASVDKYIQCNPDRCLTGDDETE